MAVYTVLALEKRSHWSLKAWDASQTMMFQFNFTKYFQLISGYYFLKLLPFFLCSSSLWWKMQGSRICKREQRPIAHSFSACVGTAWPVWVMHHTAHVYSCLPCTHSMLSHKICTVTEDPHGWKGVRMLKVFQKKSWFSLLFLMCTIYLDFR